MRLHTLLAHKTAFGALGVIAALGVGGTAYAASTTSTPATNAGSSVANGTATNGTQANGTPAKGARHGRRAGHGKEAGLIARSDHATFEVKVGGKWVTYTYDRGRVSSISANSITIARPDGQSVTETINDQTKYTGVGSESAVQTGRPAAVVSDNGVALRIRQHATGGAKGATTTTTPA